MKDINAIRLTRIIAHLYVAMVKSPSLKNVMISLTTVLDVLQIVKDHIRVGNAHEETLIHLPNVLSVVMAKKNSLNIAMSVIKLQKGV